jgi:hypothetical protein
MIFSLHQLRMNSSVCLFAHFSTLRLIRELCSDRLQSSGKVLPLLPVQGPYEFVVEKLLHECLRFLCLFSPVGARSLLGLGGVVAFWRHCKLYDALYLLPSLIVRHSQVSAVCEENRDSFALGEPTFELISDWVSDWLFIHALLLSSEHAIRTVAVFGNH